MVSILTKKIKGKEYLYLVQSVRKGHKVSQKTVRYIGKKRPIPKEEFECMKMSYSNTDWILNDFKDELSYQDHEKMKKASELYKEYVKSLDKVSEEKEKEKFSSIFISNSNAIEGSTMNVKETFDYLFKDTVPKGHNKKELFMANNLMEAWKHVEKNYNRFPKQEDLFFMHKLINRNIESEETLGKYKTIQNYIGDVHTTSFLFVEEKMKSWFKWVKKAFKKMDDFEVAFQSHAQFEIIHPFVDGNGRLGRLLLNWILIYKNLSPLALSVSNRNDYILALDNARRGKIEAISKFCFKEYIRQYKFME